MFISNKNSRCLHFFSLPIYSLVVFCNMYKFFLKNHQQLQSLHLLQIDSLTFSKHPWSLEKVFQLQGKSISQKIMREIN